MRICSGHKDRQTLGYEPKRAGANNNNCKRQLGVQQHKPGDSTSRTKLLRRSLHARQRRILPLQHKPTKYLSKRQDRQHSIPEHNRVHDDVSPNHIPDRHVRDGRHKIRTGPIRDHNHDNHDNKHHNHNNTSKQQRLETNRIRNTKRPNSMGLHNGLPTNTPDNRTSKPTMRLRTRHQNSQTME